MYKINKSPNGKWIVRWNDSVVYAADTKKKAQEYIDLRTNKKAPN